MDFFLPLLPFLLISLSTMGVPYADAWGRDGHYMVCKIAESYLTSHAKAAVQDLLTPSAQGQLAAVCSWADSPEAKRKYPWSRGLHFVNIPDEQKWECDFDYLRDCGNGLCVVGAIDAYTFQLRTYGDDSISCNLTESLMFLAHFMGDVHQPLHVGFTGDRGGNDIKVNWLSNKTRRNRSNLHSVWDTAIIRTAIANMYENEINNMIESIQEKICGEWEKYIAVHETNKYASESITQACVYAYKDEKTKDVERGSTLTLEYFNSRLPVVEKRIAQAGMRLSALLNDIFSPNQVNSSTLLKERTVY